MFGNPVGLNGMEFIEYVGPDVSLFEKLFKKLGMVAIAKHRTKNIILYRQSGINFLLNKEPGTFAEKFQKIHGPSISATGFRVFDAQRAFRKSLERGARAFEDESLKSLPCPSIYGIGDSLIYFVDRYEDKGNIYDDEFEYTTDDKNPKGHGFLLIDHMTNNVPRGEMDLWAKFYEDILIFVNFVILILKEQRRVFYHGLCVHPVGKLQYPLMNQQKINPKFRSI